MLSLRSCGLWLSQLQQLVKYSTLKHCPMKFSTKMTTVNLLNFHLPSRLRNSCPENSDIHQGVKGCKRQKRKHIRKQHTSAWKKHQEMRSLTAENFTTYVRRCFLIAPEDLQQQRFNNLSTQTLPVLIYFYHVAQSPSLAGTLVFVLS